VISLSVYVFCHCKKLNQSFCMKDFNIFIHVVSLSVNH
jgi:hypothetical protein